MIRPKKTTALNSGFCFHTFWMKSDRSVNAIGAKASELDYNHVIYTSRTSNGKPHGNSLDAETMTLDWVKSLHSKKKDYYKGEMVSGSSEGVITAFWYARKYFEALNINNISVIMTELTHFSVKKACDILRIPFKTIPFNSDFVMDCNVLEEYIQNAIKSGSKKGVVIAATLGYTMTGFSDDIKKLNNLKRKYSKDNMHIFIHLDAAMGGICCRYLNPSLPYFDKSGIDTWTVDMHKGGMGLLGTSFFLLRKELHDYMNITIPYTLGHKDYALLGSRSSIPALTACCIVKKYKNKWKILFRSLILKRNKFSEAVGKIQGVKIVSLPIDIPMLTISFERLSESSTDLLKSKFHLSGFSISRKYQNCYRIYFNRQNKSTDISTLLRSLKYIAKQDNA
jgi:tyrosine decarboxylase/aspartate 1-decarboxylase